MKKIPSIEFKNVEKNFDQNVALLKTSFQIQKGEFVVFVGPSGCGKTTTLRLIAGLEDVSSGSIFANGKDITWEAPKNRKTAMVFQTYSLYPHLSVYENLKYPLDILKLSKQDKKNIIEQTAEKLKIKDLLQRAPSQLSGGQKQRVAIGRALVRRPEIFLLDEPLSNLDARLRESMRVYIKELHNFIKKTTIYVTHDQQEAMSLADRIFVFSKGKMMQSGIPQEVYQNPQNLFVAEFLGNPPINIFKSQTKDNVVSGNYGNIQCRELGIKKKILPKEFIFAIRPHHLFVSNKGALNAKFLYSEYLGSESYYKFKMLDQEIFLQNSEDLLLKKNNFYNIALTKNKILFFNSNEQRIYL